VAPGSRLVGWEDDRGAWLMRNSWGEDWEENGYCWIAYGSNPVGRHTAWVKAKSRFYSLGLTPKKIVPVKR
jgi:C1A family cysteine protease